MKWHLLPITISVLLSWPALAAKPHSEFATDYPTEERAVHPKPSTGALEVARKLVTLTVAHEWSSSEYLTRVRESVNESFAQTDAAVGSVKNA